VEFKRIKKISDKEKDRSFNIPSSYLPTYYFDAFNILHRFENSLRIFVYSVLKASMGANWANTLTKDPGKEQQDEKGGELTIRTISKIRRNQLENYGHIGMLPHIPLLYLTMDDLVSIFTYKPNGKYFNSTFPASIEKVYEPKLKELIIIRNNLMHFRKIYPRDLERLFFNIEELSGPLKAYLSDVVEFDYSSEYIPTQGDKWHSLWTSMITKERHFSKIRISYSKNQLWPKITLHFVGAFVASENTYYHIDYSKTNKSLDSFLPQIIYYGNHLSFPTFLQKDKTVIPGKKSITLCFSNVSFNDNILDILGKVANLIDEIENEYEKVMVQKPKNIKLSYLEALDTTDEFLWIEDEAGFCWLHEKEVPRRDIPEDWSPFCDEMWFYDLDENGPWIA
jgi:hypothetical protein